jgi:signal transduction histidine kinase
MQKLLVILLCAFGCSYIISAQELQQRFVFTTADGLPSNHVYSVAEDTSGFLWITTDNGVSRFDGKKFKNYGVEHGLSGTDVLQVLKAKNGQLWFNCYRQLPCIYNAISDSFEVVDIGQISPINFNTLTRLLMLGDDSVVLSARDIALCYKGKTLIGHRRLSKDQLLEYSGTLFPYSMCGLRSDKSVFILSNSRSIIVQPPEPIVELKQINNRFFAKGVGQRLYEIEISESGIGKFNFLCKMSGNISTIEVNGDSVFFTSSASSFYNYSFKKKQLQCSIQLPHTALGTAFDAAQNLWVGTANNGLLCYSKLLVRQVAMPLSLQENQCSRVKKLPSGKVIVGQGSTTCAIYKNTTFTDIQSIIKVENILQDEVKFLAEVEGAPIIVSSNKISYGDKIAPKQKNASAKIEAHGIKCAALIDNDKLAIGTIGGLGFFSLKSAQYSVYAEKHFRCVDMCINTAKDKLYLISGLGTFYFNLRDSSFTQIFIPISNSQEVATHLVISKLNELVISTSHGNIYVMSANKMLAKFTIQNGLPTSIRSLKIDEQGTIIIGSAQGLHRIAFGRHKYQDAKISHIGTQDGLTSNVINDIDIAGDSLLLATDRGVSIVPRNFEISQHQMKVVLISAKANINFLPIQTSYNLRSSENAIALELSGIDLCGHLQFIEYALNDSSRWQALSGNLLNLQLPSGAHKIFLRCRDDNGNTSSKVLELSINIAIPFYKTWWFLLLSGMLITIIIATIFSKRRVTALRQKLAEQAMIKEERKRISADLHDDIGATLSSFNVNSSMMSSLIEKNPELAKQVSARMYKQSKQLSDTLGDIVWSLNEDKEQLMNFGARIKNYAHDVLGNTNIKYKIHIADGVNELIKGVAMRKNILLICKEALNNAAKYSQASIVQLAAKVDNEQLIINMEDNGIGFTETVSAGNGLVNMRHRAAEIGALISINTSVGKGTKIQLTVAV